MIAVLRYAEPVASALAKYRLREIFVNLISLTPSNILRVQVPLGYKFALSSLDTLVNEVGEMITPAPVFLQ